MKKIKEISIKIIKILQENGYIAVWAGGCVRDYLLSIQPKDYDIATDAIPTEIESLFEKTIPIGKSFGVIQVLMDDFIFEVATLRNDSKNTDGRRPLKVNFSKSLKEDAKRRDFTINGMFYDPINKKLHDYVNGKKDLNNKIIKFVGNTDNRIEEDYLRILRAVRFKVTYTDFVLDEKAIIGIIKYRHKLLCISQERITEELKKIFSKVKSIEFFNLFYELGIFQYLLPEIYELRKCEQDFIHHPEGNVLLHTVKVLKTYYSSLVINKKLDESIVWSILFHDIGKPITKEEDIFGRIKNHGHAKEGAMITEKVLKRMKFSKAEIDKITFLVRNHMKVKDVDKMKKSTLRKLLAQEYINELIEVSKFDSLGGTSKLYWYGFIIKELEKYNNNPKLILPDPLLNGNDLIEYGLNPGKIFSEILQKIQNLQLEGKLGNREEAIAYLIKNY